MWCLLVFLVFIPKKMWRSANNHCLPSSSFLLSLSLSLFLHPPLPSLSLSSSIRLSPLFFPPSLSPHLHPPRLASLAAQNHQLPGEAREPRDGVPSSQPRLLLPPPQLCPVPHRLQWDCPGQETQCPRTLHGKITTILVLYKSMQV